ncbi:hypothetical protein GGX14DRAFT_391778 [Mycena pura]|uniref:Uncharacterized protein n=1 Tax=Mycena pura TaxID=153505 RepID=A0AAD6VKY5_9AGAR|nr:hypothetical protein GGX14DRAFT_391778 [Mycena pura]
MEVVLPDDLLPQGLGKVYFRQRHGGPAEQWFKLCDGRRIDVSTEEPVREVKGSERDERFSWMLPVPTRALFDIPGGPRQLIFDEHRDENEPTNSRIGGELVEKQAIDVGPARNEHRDIPIKNLSQPVIAGTTRLQIRTNLQGGKNGSGSAFHYIVQVAH